MISIRCTLPFPRAVSGDAEEADAAAEVGGAEVEASFALLAAAFDCAGRAALVIDRQGRIACANVPARALLGEHLRSAAHGYVLADRETCTALAPLFAALAVGADCSTVPPAVLPRDGAGRLVAYAVGHDDLSALCPASGIVFLVDLDAQTGPRVADLRACFGLTQGEARVAAWIGAGHAPRAAAVALGIAEETVRTILKRVFAKTGVSRQSELVLRFGRLMRAVEAPPTAMRIADLDNPHGG